MTEDDKKIRVCMLSYYYFPEYSGSAIQAYNLCRHLQSKGVEPFVLAAQFSSKVKVEDVEGVTVYRIPLIKKSFSWQMLSFWVSMSWFLILNRKKYDVIHSHGTYIQSFASLIGRMLGKKSILKIAMANSDVNFANQGRVMGAFNRLCVSKFDAYIATSSEIYEELHQKALPSQKIQKLPNGVDTCEKKPIALLEKQNLKRQMNLPDSPVVLFVGHINQRKNVDLVIRVFNKVLKRGLNAFLLLVGPVKVGDRDENNPYFDELTEYVNSEGIQDYVRFEGKQKNVTPYYNASDIFFFPSKKEGMPNVLLEAMSCGLAPIVSRISGTQDIVEDGVNGLSFELDDEKGFEEALYQLLSNDEYRSGISRGARQKMESDFALEKVAGIYVDIYNRLTQK